MHELLDETKALQNLLVSSATGGTKDEAKDTLIK